MLPATLKKYVQDILANHVAGELKIEQVSPVGGGSINQAVKLDTSHGQYFLKYNNARRYPRMFELEDRGLSLLKKADEIYVPRVISYGEDGEHSFLLLEFIEAGLQNQKFWEDFGLSLANMHRNTAPKFGLDHDNYIGSLEQSNTQQETWSEFFVLERLEPLVRVASLPGDVVNRFETLYSQLEAIFPDESPSLLHGDLWSGNYMTSPNGAAAIIDPAVYYGHREMDIGMTKLFGGFPESFYGSYNATYPMEGDWQARADICNLYPLMVHVILFGGSYLSQVTSILNKYTR